MTWRTLKPEEETVCRNMVRWLEVRSKWRPDFPALPSAADISKSALFERLMSGREPLEFPPPIGFSCPWYAVVEDPGPHIVGFDDGRGRDVFFRPAAAGTGEEALVLQHPYAVVSRATDRDMAVRDAFYDTPYRFRLWFDASHHVPAVRPEYDVRGAWLMQNVDFASSASAAATAEASD